MIALEELASSLKDLFIPFIPLRRWLNSGSLDATEARIERSFGSKRAIVLGVDYDLLDPNYFKESDLSIFADLKRLVDPNDGYSNWCRYVEGHENFIPSPILSSDNDQSAQIQRLASLGRGLVIRIDARRENNYEPQYLQSLEKCPNIKDILFLFDLGSVRSNVLTLEDTVSKYLNSLAKRFPSARFAIAASSFPSSFSNIISQRIYEFDLYRRVDEAINETNRPLIYSDYGSARATPLSGGGGFIPPRIDIMQNATWLFFRPEEQTYKKAAEEANEKLVDKNSWGAKLIKNTAMGAATNTIQSQAIASRARINMHLHSVLTARYEGASVGMGRRPFEDDL